MWLDFEIPRRELIREDSGLVTFSTTSSEHTSYEPLEVFRSPTGEESIRLQTFPPKPPGGKRTPSGNKITTYREYYAFIDGENNSTREM